MNTNESKDLGARYIAGDQLSAEETACLLQRLESSPSERQELLIDEAIDSQLRCLARLNDEGLVERFVASTVQRAVAAEESASEHVDIQIRKEDRRRRSPSRLIPAIACTIAAAVVLVGVALSYYSTATWRRGDFGFAHLTNTKDLAWELLDDESRLVSFSSGSGEVHFENGATVRVTAPSIIELRSPGELFVKNGSVKMYVPPAAVGFTVETPVARIVDLGTKFDVDVGTAGSTETRVRSGEVMFEAHSTNRAHGDPIRLTADGLNRASAAVSEVTTDISSVSTTASGSQGQFFGAIHVDGETVEFDSRQKFDEFLGRLDAAPKANSTQFRERWKVMVKTTANSTSTTVESSAGSGVPDGSTGNKANEMLLEQLREMRKRHQGNPRMQELMEQMIRQAEGNEEKESK